MCSNLWLGCRYPVFCCFPDSNRILAFFRNTCNRNTNNPFKIYCNTKGKLGLYTQKKRITPARFRSIQQLLSSDYPVFVVEREGKYCLYNYVRKKYLFKGAESITLGADNTIYVERKGKKARYSPIGMCIEE